MTALPRTFFFLLCTVPLHPHSEIPLSCKNKKNKLLKTVIDLLKGQGFSVLF